MGNHDMLRTGSYYTSPLDIISGCELQNVMVYNEMTTIYLDEVAFTLIPFRDRKSFNTTSNVEAIALLDDQLVYEMASIPLHCTKVVVGHLALEGSIPIGDEIDDLSNELMCPLTMFQGYDYVWMGHVHKPQVLQKRPHIAHIGSMDISNFGETDQDKYIIVFNIEETPHFQRQKLPTRPMKKIVVSVSKDTHDTTQYVIKEINQLQSEISKAIVRLEIHLTSPELLSVDRSVIEKTLYQLGVHSVSAISESKKLIPLKKEGQQQLEMSVDVIAAVKTYASIMVDKSQQDDFIKLSLDLYDQYQQDAK
jgi:DNA repair exonuclease SbcCD nuclease subunit